ncbi:beta carbonic anhydrase 6, mitochondrial isoform X1 [Brassica napus]|uniref:beta carbonic anhydrase 6, mitochondrial isoform X1 n=1 Tax=Brassica napus TaxID=3708 RepID=UPI000BBED5AB|nr:beta carbonic anhydrase 6, mitochondrial isoform X1 [Brassica napus]
MALTLCGRARRLVSVSATSVYSNGRLQRLQQTGWNRFQLGEAKAIRLLPRRTNMVQELGSREEFMQENRDTETSYDFLGEMRQRFLRFKRQKYLPQIEKFQALAVAQSPKVMVIGCADSRVCPSYVLGFQPGEAFTIRNVANLITPIQNGPTETNSALEFAVTTLQVENIIVMGHSNCGGIAALMNHQNHLEQPSSNSFCVYSLVERWVMNGKAAKLRTQEASSHLSFDEQCRNCEKESIKDSVMNLITYPWIRDRVKSGEVKIHGCYYNLSDCSLEKWRLSSDKNSNEFYVSDKEIWN